GNPNGVGLGPIASPHMTSDVLPTPFVASSFGPYGLVSGDAYIPFSAGQDLWNTGNTSPWPIGVSIDLGATTSIVLYEYLILGNNSGWENPSAWTIQGSNDNIAWTTIDTRSGQTGSSWTVGAANTYVLPTIP